MKGKYVVNESCLLQLFRRNCPSCGSKCKLEKITHGSLLIMNQQCLQCEYRHQWKSLANASFPTAEGQHLTGDAELTAQTEQATASDDSLNCSSVPVVSEIINFSDDESDSSDEGGEESEEGDKNYSSDWEWNPPDNHLLVEELTKQSDEELCEDEDDEDSPVGLKLNQLCPECGKFFNILKPHTCEYKIKPYSCNVCGKRCVTEVSLKAHSKIHREDYEHQCRFCLVSFQTRLDKLAHEQSHQGRKKPYQCPDCSATFTNSKARNNHLRDHRGPRKHTCNVCKIEFNYVHQLRRHSVVHTGVKPFVCEVCQRSFNQAGHLKSHMRLHTGERPYKCQHCDKSFNHNVSLKSHVQRYHSQAPGSGTTQEMEKMNPNQSESEKDEMNEMESNTGDDQEKDSESGRDPDFDYVEEEEEELEEEEEEEKEEKKKDALKAKKRSTGRPLGRPKRNAAVRGASLVQAVQAEAGGSNAEAERTTGGDEESEGEQSNSDPAFDPTEEKEKRSKTKRKSTGRARGRSKISKVEENDSDSDFDPAEKRKKKTDRGQNTGKRRGRPKKKAV
ncbi:uncharacterized protein [Centroberyx affinis]|uniref:uncharacterized protein n=1 Tax=Centroberyx affinis TaxID=166261 RepID=UPI003A5BD960